MPRRKKTQTPRSRKYKSAAAIDTATSTGRAQLWHERLKRAKDELEIDLRTKTRKNNIKYIDGTYGLTAEGDHVYLNEALPAIEDIIFSGFPKLPPVQTDARQPEQEELAKQVAALLDSVLVSNLCRAKEAIIAAEWDEVEWGIGFVKSAWREEDKPENYRMTLNPEYLIPHIQAAEAENHDPESAEVAENDDDAVHLEVHAETPDLEAHIEVHQGRLGRKRFAYAKCLRVDPVRMLYDPDAEEWDERQWETELCDELVSNLQDIPGIKNLNPENCPPIDEFDNLVDKRAKAQKKWDAFDFEKTKVQVYKIHDRSNDQYIILPAREGKEIKPILEEDWPYGSLDIYHILVHRPKSGQIHGYSTLALVAPTLKEIAKTNAAIRRHVRRAANAKMVGPDISEDKLASLYTEDRPYVPLGAAAAMFKEFKPPSVPRETLQYRDMLLAELRRMLGSDIMLQGGDTPHEITATEAGLRGQTKGSRISRRKETISQVLSEIARNIAMFYHKWAQEDLIVRVMGQQGAVPMRLAPAAIPEDLLIFLDIEAVSEEQASLELQRIQQFIQTLLTLMPAQLNAWPIIEEVAERMEIHNPARFIAKLGEGAIVGELPGQPGVTRQTTQQPSGTGVKQS